MDSTPPGPGGSMEGDPASVDRAVDHAIDVALRFAQVNLGLGCGSSSPVWVRERILAMLRDRAARSAVSLDEAAQRLDGDSEAIDDLERALRVGETRFYRDPDMWKAIDEAVVRAFPARTTLNVLSAGCSTGEEAYTAAMLLKLARRSFQVLGVDRSSSALARAQRAIYPASVASHLPVACLSRYCELTPESVRVGSLITSDVTFQKLDLAQEVPPGPFHIILFKNVLLYLAEPTGEQVAARLAAELDEGGFLFCAASEVLRLKEAGLSSVRLGPGVTAFRRGK